MNPTRLLLAAGTSLMALAGQAASTGATMNVRATVQGGCAMSVDDVAVTIDNTHRVAGPPSGGGISVNCPPGTNWTLGIDAGQNPVLGPSPVRRISANESSAVIQYLIQGPHGVWGDSSLGDSFPGGEPLAGTGPQDVQPMFSFEPDGANSSAEITPGDYSDVLNLILDF